MDYFECASALDELLEKRGMYLSHAHTKVYHETYARGHIAPHFPMPAICRTITWVYCTPDPDRGLKGGVMLSIRTRR